MMWADHAANAAWPASGQNDLPQFLLVSRARVGAAVDFEQPLGVDGGVDLCRRQRRMSEQFLDRAGSASGASACGHALRSMERSKVEESLTRAAGFAVFVQP
jgi:hypothetical protein